MKYARVLDGRVMEIADFAQLPVMHPSLVWEPVAGQNAAAVTVGWTFTAGGFAPPVVTVEEERAAALAALDAAYDAKINAGIVHDGRAYQIDAASQARMTSAGALALAAVAAGSTVTWPADFAWRTADNAMTPMDAAQCLTFTTTVAGYVTALSMRAFALKDAIAAAADALAVAAIDITAGWPGDAQ